MGTDPEWLGFLAGTMMVMVVRIQEPNAWRDGVSIVSPLTGCLLKAMNSSRLYEHIERISNLVRTSVRKAGLIHGLQPVQTEALHYLSRCNHYSNTPVAVADYLGLTKGTVSQTLGVLVQDGFVKKTIDLKDRRVVHLQVTPRGEKVLNDLVPPQILTSGLENLPAAMNDQVGSLLELLLLALQQANGLKSFGTCKTCCHHRVQENGLRMCGLTQEMLAEADGEKICREHDNIVVAA